MVSWKDISIYEYKDVYKNTFKNTRIDIHQLTIASSLTLKGRSPKWPPVWTRN